MDCWSGQQKTFEDIISGHFNQISGENNRQINTLISQGRHLGLKKAAAVGRIARVLRAGEAVGLFDKLFVIRAGEEVGLFDRLFVLRAGELVGLFDNCF